MKKLRYQSVNDSLSLEIKSHPKIVPLPLYRKHIQHAIKARKEILMRGYKYFSKVSAVGENTGTALRTISRCNSSRMIYKFQFDPYLCEKSCLKNLCEVFKNIKCLRDLNIVFRRLDKVNESDIILLYLIRQMRLVKFRFEFAKTNNINDDGIINFAKIFKKFPPIKHLEEVIVDLENISDFAYLNIPKYGQKMIHIEELKVVRQKLAKLNIQGPAFIPRKMNPHAHPKLRKASLFVGIRTGWFSENQEAGDQQIFELNPVVTFCDLEQLHVKCSGAFAINEFFGMFDAIFPQMSRLANFSLEFLKISDIELITLSQILMKAPQIKKFTLKVIQHPNISKDCIHYLLKVLIRFPNLKKFDLYFRRLSLDQRELEELHGKISELENVKCVSFKNQSLHFSLNLLDENNI